MFHGQNREGNWKELDMHNLKKLLKISLQNPNFVGIDCRHRELNFRGKKIERKKST